MSKFNANNTTDNNAITGPKWSKKTEGKNIPVDETDPKDVARFLMEAYPADLPRFITVLRDKPDIALFTQDFRNEVAKEIKKKRPQYERVFVLSEEQGRAAGLLK